MKNIVFLLCLFFVHAYSYAQIVVSNDLFRNLYVGVENPISISVKNIPEQNLILSVSMGEIKKVASGKYIWKVCEKNSLFGELRVYNKSALIKSIRFKLVQIPDPKILTTTQDGEILFKGIKAWWGVRAEVDSPEIYGLSCRVDKFTITILKNDGTLVSLENIGPEYQKPVIDVFTALAVGEKVTLSDFIVTVGCETTKRRLNTILTQVHSGKLYQYRH